MPDGAELFLRLAAEADVLCENFRPGTLEKWGVGWEALSRRNQRLVLLRLSGYGQDGPYVNRVAFARLAHAMSGIGYVAGEQGRTPVNPGPQSLADYIAGVYGTVGVLLALRARDRDGIGDVVHLALYEGAFRAMDEAFSVFARFGAIRERSGAGTSRAAPNGTYGTRDRKWVSASCPDDRMFERIARAMERPDLISDPNFGTGEERLNRREQIEEIVRVWCASLTRDELMAKCIHHDASVASVFSVEDIAADPHFAARRNIVTVYDGIGGSVSVPNAIPRLSRTPGAVDSLGPRLGEGTEEILTKWLGLSKEDLRRLAAWGIV